MKKTFLMPIICIMSLISCNFNQNETSIFKDNFEKKETTINNIFSLTEDFVISEIKLSNSMEDYKKYNKYETSHLVNKLIQNDAISILYMSQRNWNSNQKIYNIIAIEFKTSFAAKLVRKNNPWKLNYTEGKIAYQNHFSYYVMNDQAEYDGVRMLSKDKKSLLTYVINMPILNLPNIEIIANEAFFARTSVKEVYFNENIQEIGYAAFAGCWNMNKIVLNDGLKQIDGSAFYLCNSLGSLIIPKSVEIVGKEIFDNGTIYCEVEKMPIGWDNNFYGENTKVYWGDQWHYENGVPTLK